LITVGEMKPRII